MPFLYENEELGSDAVCHFFFNQGHNCDTTYTSVCGGDNPMGAEYNDSTLGSTGCSLCGETDWENPSSPAGVGVCTDMSNMLFNVAGATCSVAADAGYCDPANGFADIVGPICPISCGWCDMWCENYDVMMLMTGFVFEDPTFDIFFKPR